MSASRQAETIGDSCASCGKRNVWTLPQPSKIVEILVCRFCRKPNHIITTTESAHG